jgi:hypothetical protein
MLSVLSQFGTLPAVTALLLAYDGTPSGTVLKSNRR